MKAALVTGGSSGIGFAIARMLRDDDYEVTVASRRQERVDAAADELGAYGVVANVAEEADCIRLVKAHEERFGRLDVLVNSAGIGIGGAIRELETKHLDLMLGINLRGLALVTRESVPLLCAARGIVVNLASIAGTIPTPGLAIYGATKAAVIALTKSLNYELEEDGVRATAICPGFVDTPMASWTGLDPEQMIRADDCAEMVRMLLRLGPAARIPEIVVERLGEGSVSLRA
jgi:NAD(P)-dependent dehydrogenase (short-subunit alcohol dehydrogenase family)